MNETGPIPRNLNGQTALVTGGGKRLGREIALGLAQAGCNVVIHYNHSAEDALKTAAEVANFGVKSWSFAAELAEAPQVEALFAQAVGEAGAIDVLINSASIFPFDGLRDFTPEALHRNIDINALAPALLVRRFATQGRPGAVVNLLDARMTDYDAAHVTYHLSKRMLFTLTRMQALEYAPAVRVNAVAPGLVLPPAGQDERYLQELAHTNPLNTYGNAEDVVDAVLYLVRSRFVTGQVLYVDGGRHMMGSVYGS
jgi:hypothetical protein